MSDRYPKRTWRTEQDPIAGHPRTYKNGIELDWYTQESPKGSWRSTFKWANPKEYKIPSEGMFDYLFERLGIDAEYMRSKTNFGLEPVDYDLPCNLKKDEIDALLGFVDGQGSTDKYVKLSVAHGQTMLDLMRLRRGIVENVPDLVLYPSETEQIEKIVGYCDRNKIAVYVYSGGSSVTLGVEPTVKRAVTLDLGKNFNKILNFNEINQTITVQPGIFGTDLEAYLNNPANFKTGLAYTVGHFPQSFEHSTVGGWVVTRGAGQNSAYYGKIEDLVLYQQYVTPAGTFTTERAPRKATGPDIDQLMMGGEGAYGILTEVTLKVHRLSHVHKKFSFMFKNWEDATAAMREVMQAEEGIPSIFRISDGEETEVAMHMYGIADSPLMALLKARGMKMGEMILMVGFCDGSNAYQRMTMRNVRRTAKKYGAMTLPASIIVTKWEGGRFSDPYLRDNYQDFGVIIDTLECAVNWDNLDSVHDFVRKFITSRPNVICTCHISHCYRQGANLYFIWMQKDEGLEEFRKFHAGVLTAIKDSGASVSHHHGIGKLFAPYNAESLGETQMGILRALKNHFDPNDIMNPGGTLGLD